MLAPERAGRAAHVDTARPFSTYDGEKGMAGDTGSDRDHKFKIGDIVNYRPSTRVRWVPSGLCLITGLVSLRNGHVRYKVVHPSEGFERVAIECDLSTPTIL